MKNRFVDFKALAKSLAFGAVTAAVILLSYYGIIPYNRMTSIPIFAICGTGIFFFFKYLKEAIPRSTVEFAFGQVFRALAVAINFVFGPVIDLGRRLGLFQNKYKKGRDESSFIFMQPEFKPKKAARHMPKWKDLTDNSQRVRWLFMKYLNFRIKKGYHFRRTLTPRQLAKELYKDLDEEKLPAVKLLFDTYHLARYDDAVDADIGDELVAELRDKI